MALYIIFLFPIIVYLLNYIFKKKLLLLNYTGKKHQKFAMKDEIPLSGGIILLICMISIFSNNIILSICLFSIFFVGLSSDTQLINSPKIRFFFQIIVLLLATYFLNLEILNTRINFLDLIIKNKFFSFFFVIFCILIVVNGTNFIDGLNTNVLGYYLILSFCIYTQNFHQLLGIENLEWKIWIYCLFVLYLFNFFKKLFIGDSGSYLLGFFYSYILIKVFSINPSISPFYIILLLWYPCFEILFSIVRKINFSQSPLNPDTNHLHQIFFSLIKKLIKNKYVDSNTLAANIINLYNLVTFFFSSLYIYNSKYQICLILLNLISYTFIYLLIMRKIKRI